MNDLHSVLVEILNGKEYEESPIDLIYLVTTMANGVFAYETLDSAMPENLATQYIDLVKRSGEILCPLFSPVKHPEYIQEMKDARLRLEGISMNLDLQRRYGEALRMMVSEGMLRDVEVAVATNVWRYLPSGDAGLGQR